jgi:hypothetical protein
MARGWESKSVEGQIEERGRPPQGSPQGMRSAEDMERERKKSRLILDRTRIVRELREAANPRFRAQLEAELAFLDGQIGLL